MTSSIPITPPLSACMPREVGGDDLEHTNHTSALRLHALVGAVEDLGLLQERSGRPCLLVELLQDLQSLSDRVLGLLGIADRLRVLCLFGLTELGRLLDCCVNRRNQLRDLLGKLRDLCGQSVDLAVQELDLVCLLLASLLVRRQLRVAPGLV